MSNQITPNPSVPSQVVQEVKFPKFVNNLGIIPTSYKDSMSYYECLAWLCKYLEETVIPTVNENGEAVEELQGLYIELNSYVTNYFDNLDVQEEINNKLDHMVQTGELQELLDLQYNDLKSEVNEQIAIIDNKITSATSGSPAGVYSTVSALESADPDHSKIYLVTADGKWYYYNTSNTSWTAGGTYQSTGIADHSIKYIKTDFIKLNSINKVVLNDRNYTFYGITINENGTTGKLSLNGTCTQNQSLGFGIANEMDHLTAGTYTFDVCVESGSIDSPIAVAIYGKKVSDNSNVTLMNVGINQMPYSFNVTKEVYVTSMSFWIVSGRHPVNWTIFPQLQKTSNITQKVTGKQYEFTNSYLQDYLLNGNISPTDTNFAYYDKTNYLILMDLEKTSNGVTSYSDSKTGILELNGTCTNTQSFDFGDANKMEHLTAGTYTFDLCVQSGSINQSVGVTVYAKKVSDDSQVTLLNIGNTGLPLTFTVSEEVYVTSMSFWITSGKVFSHWKLFPQLQKTSNIIVPVSAKNVLLDSNYVNFNDVYNKLIEFDNSELLLCNNLKGVKNKELSIYYGSILRNGKTNEIYQTESSSLINYNDCFRINKTNNTYSENLKIKMNNILKNTHEKTISLNVLNDNAGSGVTKKCLFIGDSLTNLGVYTDKLLDLFENDVMSIELVGTRGTSPNLHEGRNSWSAYSYTHDDVYGELSNPFWNPTSEEFDFDYYMTSNDFSDIDIVGIMLGTNDFGIIGSTLEEYVANLQTMIDSIHDYDSNIIIMLMTPPSLCQLEPYYFSWINSINRSDLGIIKNFDNKESQNIYICPVHYNVDPLHDFTTTTEPINEYSLQNRTLATDYVHPANIGFYHIADIVYCYLKYFGSLS